MAADDEDLPASYLYFVIAAMVLIGATIVAAFLVLIRN